MGFNYMGLENNYGTIGISIKDACMDYRYLEKGMYAHPLPKIRALCISNLCSAVSLNSSRSCKRLLPASFSVQRKDRFMWKRTFPVCGHNAKSAPRGVGLCVSGT